MVISTWDVPAGAVTIICSWGAPARGGGGGTTARGRASGVPCHPPNQNEITCRA